jgi:copper(I)-binding protein
VSGSKRCIAFSLAGMLILVNASVAQPHASTSAGILSVEHAQVLLPTPGGEQAQGFLTIWNPSGETFYLKGIESTDFAVIRVEPANNGASEFWIPAESELAMKPGGLQLTLEEPIREMQPGQTIELRFATGTGDKFAVNADIVASRLSLIDHHHAEGDRPFASN